MQQGASPYGAPPPEPTPFNVAQYGIISTSDHLPPADAAPPIGAGPPPPAANLEVPGPSAHGNFPDDDFGERGAVSGGNRWPRQETLALLKIRSEMDAAFRDATLKGPLWDDVSRKLEELGCRRSARKCKEKFENVLKYYKRTKEGRAGRQDGKSYRFFDQLEALHSCPATITAGASATTISASIPAMTLPTTAISAPTPSPAPVGLASMAGSEQPGPTPPPFAPSAGVSFSSDTSSLPESETEADEDGGQGRKRKRGGASKAMMAFLDGMMRQVMERQDAMQQRFLEAIEKREQDRMVREEAWRRQEMASLAREYELLAQERSAAAARDAAIIAFLQKITGHTAAVPVPPPPPKPPQPQPQPQPAQLQPQPQPAQLHQQQQSINEVTRHQHQPSSMELVSVPEPQDTARSVGFEPASSRWPKVEVHALINLRSRLEMKYQEAGPKGPLWEEVSAEMGLMGYSRSAKRCKEKWENINKYFKKVKESSKKRPEDAKTCPYFHQLDALYRQKTGGGSPIVTQRPQPQETSPNLRECGESLAIMAPPVIIRQSEPGSNNHGNVEDGGGPNKGGLRTTFFEEARRQCEGADESAMAGEG